MSLGEAWIHVVTCMVLGTPATGGTLPRIYVNICSVGRPTRVVAAVDTCSSRNLISQQLVASLGAPVSPTTAIILAIDGTPLDVCGMVELTVERTHGAVNLPKTSSKLIVVADLSTVRIDVVLGEELFAAVGRINLRCEKGCSVIFGQSPDLQILVSNPSSMGGQDHIQELKHTSVASETEVITNNRKPNAPTPKVVDLVGLPDSPRSQTGDVDRAMLGHSHPKQLDSSGDLPYQSRIAARHPLSFSSIISLCHFPHFVFFFILLLLSGGGV